MKCLELPELHVKSLDDQLAHHLTRLSPVQCVEGMWRGRRHIGHRSDTLGDLRRSQRNMRGRRGYARLLLGAIVALLIIIALLFVAHPFSNLSTTSGLVKVRLFWVRHGLSCANVLDKCSFKQSKAEELLSQAERALQMVPGYESAALNQRTYGLKPAVLDEGDCTVQVSSPGLPLDGEIIRLHDMYTDPALTDCSRRQSVEAGRSFMKWLQRNHIKIHFVGSSFLMRAFQTAYGMFNAPCGEKVAGLDCGEVFAGSMPSVTPVPYMTERAPAGMTALQQDNLPRSFEQQQQMTEKVYGNQLSIDDTYTNLWPRFAQQYEKFKATLLML